MGADSRNEATCPHCDQAVPYPAGATGIVSCGRCGGEFPLAPPISLLSLELPPEGAAPPPSPVARAAVRERGAAPPAPEEKRAARPEGPVPARIGRRAHTVSVLRSSSPDLPEQCACCFGEPGGHRVESKTAMVGGYTQSFAVHVPYCAACLNHHRRPRWRVFAWVLAFFGLGALHVTVLKAAPDSALSALAILAALLVASRAASYLLVPRFPLGTRHAREGRSLWVDRLESSRVRYVLCNEAYLALLASATEGPQMVRKRQFWRWVSGLLFGSAAELSKSPAWTCLRAAATFAAMSAAVWALTPPSEEEKSYRAFKAAPNVGAASDFASRFRKSGHLKEMEDYVWSEAEARKDLYAYRQYLRHFPAGANRARAEKSVEELVLADLRKEPSLPAAVQYLRSYPASPQADEVRDLMIAALEKTSYDPQASPPPAVLRRIYQAAPAGAVKVKVSGFKDAEYRRELESGLRQSLEALGLTAEFTEEGAIIDVQGENGLNTSVSYSKFGFGTGSGPYGEYARAEVRVQFGPGQKPAWTGRASASSPQTVRYTTYRPKYSAGFDTGPSQSDVHRQTVPAFSTAAGALFRYR